MSERKEIQLEQAAQKVINELENLTLAPPIFELFTALLTMSLSILMFSFPELLEGKAVLYDGMVAIMPQVWWATAFFVAGVSGAIGMLINSKSVRKFGLMLTTMIFAVLTGIYATYLPNFGFVFMGWIMVFAGASIPMVKYTGIWTIKKERNNNDTKNDRFS